MVFQIKKIQKKKKKNFTKKKKKKKKKSTWKLQFVMEFLLSLRFI